MQRISLHKLNNKRGVITRDDFIDLAKHFSSSAAGTFKDVNIDIYKPDCKLDERKYHTVDKCIESLTSEEWDKATYIGLSTFAPAWIIACRRLESPHDIEIFHETDMNFPIFEGKLGDAFFEVTRSIESIAESLIARPRTERILKDFIDKKPSFSMFREID